MAVSAKKISNRERQRLAQTAILRYQHQRLILLGVLGASGGEVIVKDSDLATVSKYGDDVDYAIVEGKTPGESIVRLVVGSQSDRAVVHIEDDGNSLTYVTNATNNDDKGIPGTTDAQVSA